MTGTWRLVLSASLLATLVVQLAGYPDYYVQNGAYGCFDHPTRALGSHGTPVPDSGTTFRMLDPLGQVAKFMCPGVRYSVTVKFPEPRLALVTASLGELAGASDRTCANRMVTRGSPSDTVNTFLTIPCNQKEGGVQIKSTSAKGSDGAYLFADVKTKTLTPENPGCQALSKACLNGGKGDPLAGLITVPLTPSAYSEQAAAPVLRILPKTYWRGVPGMNRSMSQFVHGLLMLAAFVLLLPIGTLFARHKWMFGRNSRTGRVSAAFFYLHVGCQLLGVATGLIGFVVALLAFGWKNYPGYNLYAAHKWMGIGILLMALLQILAASVRPRIATPYRKKWNAFHWNWGRLVMLAGLANVILGGILAHDLKDQSYLLWLLPVAICVALLGASAIVMEAFKRQYEKTLRYNPCTHELKSVWHGWASSKKHPRLRPFEDSDSVALRDNYGGDNDIASAYEDAYSDISPTYQDHGERV